MKRMILAMNKFRKPIRLAVWVILVCMLISIGLAWISSGFSSLRGWHSFFILSVIVSAFFYWIWRAFLKLEQPKSEKPITTWIIRLAITAGLLRLLLGVFFFTVLPIWGYGNPQELAGYTYSDAFARDVAAWDLAESGRSLWTSFRDFEHVDQYGGYLFLSAFVYRFMGSETHQPLLITIIGTFFSTAGVLFTWAFARRMWNENVGRASAWFIALLPEAILLSGSQMRESILIGLCAFVLYALIYYWQERKRRGLGLIFGGLLLSLPLSPPVTGLLILMLVVIVIALDEWRIFRKRALWITLGVVMVLVIIALWLTWGRIAPEGISNPIELVQWWIVRTATWQSALSERASGWVEKVLKTIPEWSHPYFLLIYGIVRPLLPAAVVASGAPLWKGIAIWRALGWTVLLIFLLYGLLVNFRKRPDRSKLAGIVLSIWLGIIVASFRGGGDLWDNPRYRAVFSSLQIGYASWAWIEYQRLRDPWFRRAIGGTIMVIIWFIPWYVRRYFPVTWPVINLFRTIGLGLLSAALYVLWDWVRTEGKQRTEGTKIQGK